MKRPTSVAILAPALALVLVLGLSAAPADAAQIVIVNLDAGTGVGLADPTPAVPVGNNPGTTLGAQRLNAFIRAADVWGSLLVSNVPIRLAVTMQALPCNAFSAVLGSAGPQTVFRDYPGAPVAATWFVEAEANSHAGFDLGPATDDGIAQFNGNIDFNNNCLANTNFYYGFDQAPPGNDIDFLTVILHEMGHAFGFLSLVSQNGQLLAGFHDIWNNLLFDMTTFLTWRQMTPAQRAASAINVDPVTGESNLTWVGNTVFANSGGLTGGLHSFFPVIEMFTANPYQPGSSVSHWHTQVTPNELMEPFFTAPSKNVGLADDLMTDVFWGTTPPAFVHYTPIPGPAGNNTVLTTDNGIPGGTSFLIFGTTPGPFAIAGCPNLGIANPTILASGPTGATGEFNFQIFVPPNLAGFTVLFQGLEISGSTCNVSNLVTHTF